MRFGSMMVAALAVACWSCGKGSDREPTLPAEDYSASYAGTWIGTQGGTVDGTAVTPGLAAMEVTREGSNRLRLGDGCPDGSSIPLLVVAPDAVAVSSFTCPIVAVSGCAAVTMAWRGGSGTLASGVLSLQLDGTMRGCGRSAQVTLRFDAMRDAPPPQITALDPASALAGQAGLTLAVRGSGFGPGSVVRFGGLDRATTFVSTGELRAPVGADDLAVARVVPVTAANVDGQAAPEVAFEVRNPLPTLSGLVPDTVVNGAAGATLTLSGAGFVAASTAAVGGLPRATTFLSGTRLRVALLAEDLAGGGQRAITVVNPAPGGGTSAPVTLQILAPAPVATGLAPSAAAVGGPRLFVTVAGSGFVSTSSVTWNGGALRTHLASPGLLSAEVPADHLAQAGTAAIAVVTPPPGGGSAPVGTFTIAAATAAPPRSVAYQIDPAHSGRARSGGALAFPAAAAWSVSLPDEVSYPLVAEGKAFVLVRGPASGTYGTRLYALDLATGAIAWGPLAISGTSFWAGHAYDGGRLFVLDFDGRLRSFDAATGAAGWEVSLPGQYAFSAAPSAEGGVVFVGGSGGGGTVYAVRESDGTVLWTSPVANGGQSSPAVAPDAVYVSYPCQVYKLDRLTGTPLWHVSSGCSGGGGKTAAYADGFLFVRDPAASGAPAAAIFDGLDGALTGAFSANAGLPIPALTGGARFQLAGGALERWEAGAARATWSFAGDGHLVSAPIVLDDAVVVGSGMGQVFAVDATTGLQRWAGAAGAALGWPDEQNVSQPLTGLGAGEGYLVVPAGRTVTAWRITGP